MSNQDITIQKDISVLTRGGVHDNILITQTRGWQKVNGILAIFGVTYRLNGKRPSFFRAAEHILSIHSNNRGGLYVQTDVGLYLYNEYELLADEVTSDVDGSVVIDDVTGQHILAA